MDDPADVLDGDALSPRERFRAAVLRKPMRGRIPHFELVCFLTMESLGKVHPSHRSCRQWDQMTEAESESLREQAIETMMQFRPEAEAVLPLLLRMAPDEGAYPSSHQWAAWKAIGELGPDAASAVPGIVEFIQGEPQYTYAVPGTLKEIGPGASEAVDELIKIAQRRGSTYSGGGSCRSRACEVLGRIGRQAAGALPVFRRAAHDQSSVVRRAAREAIGVIEERQGTPEANKAR